MRQVEINALVAARASLFWQAVIVEGRSAASVARDHGIRRERVRQIIMRHAGRMGCQRDEYRSLAALRARYQEASR